MKKNWQHYRKILTKPERVLIYHLLYGSMVREIEFRNDVARAGLDPEKYGRSEFRFVDCRNVAPARIFMKSRRYEFRFSLPWSYRLYADLPHLPDLQLLNFPHFESFDRIEWRPVNKGAK